MVEINKRSVYNGQKLKDALCIEHNSVKLIFTGLGLLIKTRTSFTFVRKDKVLMLNYQDNNIKFYFHNLENTFDLEEIPEDIAQFVVEHFAE